MRPFSFSLLVVFLACSVWRYSVPDLGRGTGAYSDRTGHIAVQAERVAVPIAEAVLIHKNELNNQAIIGTINFIQHLLKFRICQGQLFATPRCLERYR